MSDLTPTKPTPVEVLSRLCTELAMSTGLLTDTLSGLNVKDHPCTFQSFRWLAAKCVTCNQDMGKLAVLLGFILPSLQVDPMRLTEIPLRLADAESRLHGLIDALKLDDLPPGNPGETRFEAELKVKVAQNRALTHLLHELAELSAALASPTYKIGINEEQREAAWREARKTRLTEVLDGIDKQLADAREFIAQVEKSRAAVVEKLSTNDQMTFMHEIDKSQTPEIGETNGEAGHS